MFLENCESELLYLLPDMCRSLALQGSCEFSSLCPSLCSNIFSEKAHGFFLIFCMKLGFHKHKKAAGPIFVENFCYGQNLGKLGIFGPKVNKFSLLMLDFSEIIPDDRH